jgi:hypothetical protein
VVQVAQRLLQRDTGDRVASGRLRLVLHGRERRRRLMVAETFVTLVLGIRAQAQRPIVDIARAAKRPRQDIYLRG